jgi:phosphohistidine phosphatase
MVEKNDKQIFFLRHAKSSWKYPDLHDYDRPLNDRGKENAPKMGRKLKKLGVQPDLIISSPANRAVTTARIVCEKIEYPLHKLKLEDKIYMASARQLLNIIQELDDKYQQVMIIGHEPAFSQVIEILCKNRLEKFPTCAAIQISLQTQKWSEVKEGTGKIIFFEYPKKIND